MPTYKNVTSLRQTLSGKTVEPGQIIYTTSYHNENEVKLLKIDDAPYHNPIILSDVVMYKGEIKIPEIDDLGNRVVKFSIHFFVEKGRVTIRYNSIKNDPPLYLYEAAKWNVRCYDRTINSIIVDANESFILNLIIEKI